jgi:hypothetical protein
MAVEPAPPGGGLLSSEEGVLLAPGTRAHQPRTPAIDRHTAPGNAHAARVQVHSRPTSDSQTSERIESARAHLLTVVDRLSRSR